MRAFAMLFLLDGFQSNKYLLTNLYYVTIILIYDYTVCASSIQGNKSCERREPYNWHVIDCLAYVGIIESTYKCSKTHLHSKTHLYSKIHLHPRPIYAPRLIYNVMNRTRTTIHQKPVPISVPHTFS